MAKDRYTLAYRAVEAKRVMNWVAAGQSGSLVGLRGAGKSNFLRFLLRPDVQRHYLGQGESQPVFILVNLLALTQPTMLAVYELILSSLSRQLGKEQIGEQIAVLHRQVAHSEAPTIAQQAFERAVDLICEQQERRLVLLLDEFDAVFRLLDPSLFRCLRAVRDEHKEQVCYLVVVTDELSIVREDLLAVEHFYRLFSRNVCGLGPYSEHDARQMVRHLAFQRSAPLGEAETTHLIEVCGGHAGLLKAVLSQWWSTFNEGSLIDVTPRLAETRAVQAECHKIWQSLPKEQQTALCTLSGGLYVDADMLSPLRLKGLIRQGAAGPLLFSPIFDTFVRHQGASVRGIIVSRSPRRVQISGREIGTLSELEFELLCYLYERRGQVCTKDELIQHVYRGQYDTTTGSMSDEMLYKLISRLRAKIGTRLERRQYILTVRGEGYRFVEPDNSQGH